MAMMKVFKKDGALINIGDWDYQVSRDEDGVEIIGNPLPSGAVEAMADIVTGYDGGLYEADDPHRLGPSA